MEIGMKISKENDESDETKMLNGDLNQNCGRTGTKWMETKAN
jgi:hypothetical protein